MWLLLVAGIAASLAVVGPPLLSGWLNDGFPTAVALADDDDGDDDGGGGGGDDDGGDDNGDDNSDDEDEPLGKSVGLDPPGKVIVTDSLHDDRDAAREILAIDADAATIRNLVAEGFVIRERQVLTTFDVSVSRLTIPPSLSLPAALARARQVAPEVGYEPNTVYRIADDGDQAVQSAEPPCAGSDCFAFNMVGWPSNPAACGGGLRIGMTDTAVDRDHPALRAQAIRYRRFASVGPERQASADHGTAVAALLVGDPASGFAGMLPSASLYAADVFHLDRAGRPQATLTDLVNGLDWLATQRVSVINISMTGAPNRLLESAIRMLGERGIGVIAAAGNGGPTAAPAFPAAYDGVVSVTAVDQGLHAYRMANQGDYIAFASPGVEIWSAAAGGTGRYRSGTSVAAAHVSAAIAEIIGESGVDIDEAKRALRRDARDLGTPGRDRVFGWGLIQATPMCRS